MANVVLRLPAVKAKTGLSRSSIYSFMFEGRFPEAIPIGVRAIGWLEREVDAWIAGQEQARNIAQKARATDKARAGRQPSQLRKTPTPIHGLE